MAKTTSCSTAKVDFCFRLTNSTAYHDAEEHHEIKRLVYDADITRPGHDLDNILSKAFHAFDAHAKEEESGILSQMGKALKPEEKDVRRASYFPND
jgi:hypothetical protein